MSIIEKAILKAGGQVKFSQLVGVTQGAVSYWKRGGSISPKSAKLIEKATGIPRATLRPDIFR